jgi:Lon protease-like protein
MSHLNPEEISFCPDEFSGTARLFPLPNLVLFPHVMQPLHIFEPRYRQLFEDAMASDRLITMAVVKPGGTTDAVGQPKLHRTACLGKVVTYQRLPEGRYNLLLIGVRRIRLRAETASDRMYRIAQSQIVDDVYSSDDKKRENLQKSLVRSYRRLLPSAKSGADHLDHLFGQALPLGMLTDIIAYTVTMDLGLKQQLLESVNVEERAEKLLDILRDLAELRPARPLKLKNFPPQFSVN